MADKTPEEQAKAREEVEQLHSNSVFSQMQTRLTQRLQTKSKELRQALRKSDSAQAMRISGEMDGLEHAINIMDAQFLKQTENPTKFKY